MQIKISSDKNMKKGIGDFFEKTEMAACRSHEKVDQAMSGMFSRSDYSCMVDGVVFKVDDTLNDAAEHIVKTICKALGTLAGDEDHVSKTLWKHAAARFTDPKEIVHAVDAFLADVESNANVPRRYINESRVLRLDKPIERFNLGPVGVVTGDGLAKELSELSSIKPWNVEVGEPGMHLDLTGGNHKVGVGLFNWDIKIVAANAHLAEEAAWLAGVAISLLRLAAGRTLGPFGPRNGEVEPHVFRHSASGKTALIATETGLSNGGWSRPSEYHITKDALAICTDAKFQAIVSAIFEPAKSSIGERVRQSLGWLARGRQSEDRAERMLYFFTALEAMLSADDKSVPVVQTIARNAASILTNKPEGRARNAKLIKDLYTRRSALVHAGTRGVTKRQANTVQRIAEVVCWRILDQVDLAQSVKDFQAELAEASYGLPWGKDGVHLLPRLRRPEADDVEGRAAADSS